MNFLKNLKVLVLSVIGKEEIDLAGQHKLESLTIHWRKNKIFGLDQCKNLKVLCLINFDEEDLSQIANLKQLIDLQIVARMEKGV